jgi:hypothetical protein
MGARVFPCSSDKRPLTNHGFLDASSDPAVVLAFWARWPFADIGLATGGAFVVVDLDRKGAGRDGFKDFRELDGRDPLAINTAIASTPSSGLHLYFRTEGSSYRSRPIRGRAIDVRGDGGYVIAPGHQDGRRWLKSPRGSWETAPTWLLRENQPALVRERSAKGDELMANKADGFSDATRASRYGRATLEFVCSDIVAAPNGAQEITFNSGGFRIGQLIGSRDLPRSAEDDVLAAGLKMLSYDRRRPWTRALLEKKLARAIANGMARPYRPAGNNPCR